MPAVVLDLTDPVVFEAVFKRLDRKAKTRVVLSALGGVKNLIDQVVVECRLTEAVKQHSKSSSSHKDLEEDLDTDPSPLPDYEAMMLLGDSPDDGDDEGGGKL